MNKFQIGDLLNLIPPEVVNEKLRSGDCEIDHTMLCFEENYVPIANNVPRDFVIVDAGCYMAAQSYFFQDFTKYVGVDCYDNPYSKDSISMPFSYRAPDRFITKNSEMYCMTIKDFIDKYLNKFDLDRTYFICSAVPSFEQTDELFDKVKNCAVFYPGRDSMVKGINSEIIIEEQRNLKEKFYSKDLLEELR